MARQHMLSEMWWFSPRYAAASWAPQQRPCDSWQKKQAGCSKTAWTAAYRSMHAQLLMRSRARTWSLYLCMRVSFIKHTLVGTDDIMCVRGITSSWDRTQSCTQACSLIQPLPLFHYNEQGQWCVKWRCAACGSISEWVTWSVSACTLHVCFEHSGMKTCFGPGMSAYSCDKMQKQMSVS